MADSASLWQELTTRASHEPFLAFATAIFALAVLHTFLAPRLEPRLRGTLLHPLGEVELVLGAWAVVLLLALAFWPGKGPRLAWEYLVSADVGALTGGAPAGDPFARFLEPLFVLAVMVMAGCRPVLSAAGRWLAAVARLLGDTPLARWLSVLALAPLLGSLITEPAAMTLAALLLSDQFRVSEPSPRLRYATLGLLFVNVSIGGTLTHFAAPPVVMVAARWGWTTPGMFAQFGLRSLVAIVLACALYAWVFRGEFARLAARPRRAVAPPPAVPAWLTLAHLALVAACVLALVAHRPILVVASLAACLALRALTPRWQDALRLRPAVLVAAFLAALVIHGGLQGWWIGPVLERLGPGGLFAGATCLTAFNDNAAITFLAAQVPALSAGTEAARALQHAVLAGAVTGGGLTVIANAPNPAGQSILAPHFPGGVSPLRLALWALPPTVIAGACLML